MKKLFTLLFTTIILSTQAQTIISGKVSDKKGEVLPFANVALQGTYDGASANENGLFTFSTDEKGSKKLVVTMVGFLPFSKEIELKGEKVSLEIKLEESINSLNAVVVTAGMFEASDEKKMVMLKPLDIVTTAGGNADIVSVMQLLPGSNRVGEKEGLFVRGGSANETKTVIDGMIVQNPFFSSTPDVPQRGRFDPFMFKGTAFSTGGYSALYGQALSSVLLLNTQDKLGENTSTTVSANLASAAVTHTHKGWLTGTVYYSNITPLISLIKNAYDFEKVPEGVGASVSVNENFKHNNSLKIYGTIADNRSAINLPTYDEQNSKHLFDNKNKNAFTNASYRQSYKDGLWVLNSGFSYSKNLDNLSIGGFKSDRDDQRIQGRLVMSRLFGNNRSSSFNFGGESHFIDLSNIYGEYNFKLKDRYSALFAESEFYVSPKLAIRIGIRGEYTSVINKFNAAPRISLAYKTGKYSQVSFAGGRFYQNPDKEYLYLNKNLGFEIADHAILNYQIIKDNRTFRTEIFYKKYSDLIVEKTGFFDPNPYRFPSGPTSNNGNGYARGFDMFIRDQKSIKNADLWLTYSFLDTERYFRNYPTASTPSFASKHNMSLVYKQFFNKISTNLGVTFSQSTGRPTYILNDDFKKIEYLKAYQNLSLMASKIKQTANSFIVFYVIVDNALGRNNVFGYRYSLDGTKRFEVNPMMKRSIFFGATWTFGKLNGRSKEAELDF
ncbi:TonB-dependent receptor [Lacihabitans sp. LS3-19]|uniref:TonB-dependent receptor n=1 Tax=Lacihabitans sp. LS3-19 TaxID=2487335 RepID=UPI0020CBD905|nr:TonB-dependent receptor [Lacihabitans sp. LS3-19]MCP9770173.1 TonB-dependent receptor [Lacihabitans sp. LS3-19]